MSSKENSPSCLSCKYSQDAGEDVGDDQVVCRRFPPVLFTDDDERLGSQTFVLKTDWCGEWHNKKSPIFVDQQIADCELSARAGNALMANNIMDVKTLLEYTPHNAKGRNVTSQNCTLCNAPLKLARFTIKIKDDGTKSKRITVCGDCAFKARSPK